MEKDQLMGRLTILHSTWLKNCNHLDIFLNLTALKILQTQEAGIYVFDGYFSDKERSFLVQLKL